MPTAEASTPGPDVAHAGHLQQSLDRAVLAPGAVQQREDHVDLAERLRHGAGLVHDELAAVGPLASATGARVASTSGSLSPVVIASRSGSPDSSTQRPSLVMPTGITS